MIDQDGDVQGSVRRGRRLQRERHGAAVGGGSPHETCAPAIDGEIDRTVQDELRFSVNEGSAGEADPLRHPGVGRVGEQDTVAGIDQHQERVEERLARTAGDDDLAVVYGDTSSTSRGVVLFESTPTSITQDITITSSSFKAPSMSGFTGARFGDSIAIADFDGDGSEDVAIGAPGYDSNRGTVLIRYATGGGG